MYGCEFSNYLVYPAVATCICQLSMPKTEWIDLNWPVRWQYIRLVSLTG